MKYKDKLTGYSFEIDKDITIDYDYINSSSEWESLAGCRIFGSLKQRGIDLNFKFKI